ncbi:MAG: hypothetical protein E6G01_11525 [Actinobacteria bacterium]|nr:MAG: hypothetical protein E6G01_11525 [Actinomycetota bacterium]
MAAAVVAAAVVSAVLATSGSSGPERSSRTAAAQHGGSTTTTVPPPPPPPPPADAHPLASAPLPGEGHWVPAGRVAVWAPEGRPNGTVPVVYTTTLRPGNGSAPTGLAWINTKLTKTVLYAGTGEPAPQLVAAFNSGFRLGTGSGGWYTAGRAALPLQDGYASLVMHADGSATVGVWGRDVTLTPDVVSVRQNLHPLVDGGAPANLGSSWGATLGGGSNVWRSAVGVDAGGNLIYAAGPALDPAGLANVLVAAGCVRAMELDINPQWVSFSTYAPVPLAAPDQVQGPHPLARAHLQGFPRRVHPLRDSRRRSSAS